MATEFTTYTQLAGVIVPAKGWRECIISDLTTAQTLVSEIKAGEASTDPGDPGAPQMASTLRLDATGVISATQELATVRGGTPSLDDTAMRIVWKDETGTWRGHHDQNVISDIDTTNKVFYGPVPAISSDEYHVRNTCMLADGSGGCIILTGLVEQVTMQHYLPETFDLTATRIIAEKGDANSERGTEDRSGIASTLPVTGYVDGSGTVTCFHFVVNQASTEAGIRNDTYSLWATRCDGSFRDTRYPQAGFRTVGNWAIPIDIGLTANSVITSLVCAADDAGNVLLFINLVPDKSITFPVNHLYQFASNNGGLTFSLVDVGITTLLATYPAGSSYAKAIDVVFYKGSFLVLKAKYNYFTSRTELISYKIPSPYLSILDLAETTIADDLVGDIDNIAAYLHSDGRAFCLVSVSNISGPNTGETYLLKTEDSGLTWSEFRSGFGKNFRTFQMSACEVEGRAIILTGALNNIAGFTGDDEHLFIIKAGGWESITHPRYLGTAPYEVRSYGTNRTLGLTSALYLPNGVPSTYAGVWTTSSTGTFSQTITPGQPWLNLIKSTSSSLVYLATLADCTWNTGIIVAATMEHTSGGFLYVDAQIKNSVIMYSAQIRLTSTHLQLVDGNTGIVIGQTPVSSGTVVKCKLAFRRATAQLFIQTSDGVWQSVIQSSVFVGASGPTGNGEVRFGLPTTYTGAAVGRFYFVGAINTAGGGDPTYVPSGGGLAIAYNDDLSVFSNLTHVPFGLHGAPVPPTGSGKVVFPSGLRLSASSGYSQRGELHSVDPYSKYALDRTLISSPSIKAKVEVSSSTSSELIYEMDEVRSLGDAAALTIRDTDLSEVVVSTSDDGVTWKNIGDVSFIEETNLTFVRSGTSIMSTGSSAGTKFYELDELIGCKVIFSGGVIAKVTGNSAGRFNGVGKGMQIHLEWLTGTPPTSGTFQLARREATSIFTNIQALDQAFKFIKLTIPSQTTVNWRGSGQYWAYIGSVLFGTFVPFSNKYSSTRAISSTPNIVESKSRNGMSKISKIGRSRREISIQWAEGYDTTEGSSSSPGSFISLPQGYDIPVGHRGSATILEGIQRAVEDGELPLVYIPKLTVEESLNEYGDVFSWVLVGEAAGTFGQIVDGVSRDVVLGEEDTSEVIRLSGLIIKELI